MKIAERIYLKAEERSSLVREALAQKERLALITSIDGHQLLTLLVAPATGAVRCFETPVENGQYHSITPTVPQAHWFERTTWDMFGLIPEGHLRLKHTHLHEPYDDLPAPLAPDASKTEDGHKYTFLPVEGEGIFQIPVGPIHAGIIEPGHFRFSCSGEQIVNLEIRLGYVHRGVEKRLTEVPLGKAHFVAESAASDMPVANALAHCNAVESMLDITPPQRASMLRCIALEIERIAMHISDLGGLGGDIGFLAIASSMARLRGMALKIGELISGSRLMRGYLHPGGVAIDLSDQAAKQISQQVSLIKKELAPVLEFFLDNQVAVDRMEGVGKVSLSLARDFGLVGVAGRACGLDYDCRKAFAQENIPLNDLKVITDTTGDVLARARVRIGEIDTSLEIIESTLNQITAGNFQIKIPTKQKANSTGLGIVESHRGELIHLLVTDEEGKLVRYCIKDASVENWTGLAIATRNNLVADFPLCNKSFSLSYSGHDL
jgi:Ni,Fe-hydrogenase III large subunit